MSGDQRETERLLHTYYRAGDEYIHGSGLPAGAQSELGEAGAELNPKIWMREMRAAEGGFAARAVAPAPHSRPAKKTPSLLSAAVYTEQIAAETRVAAGRRSTTQRPEVAERRKMEDVLCAPRSYCRPLAERALQATGYSS